MNSLTNQSAFSPAVRRVALVGCATAALFTGCLGSGRAKLSSAHLEPSPTELGAATARIASVNPELGFVVIDFASQTVPTPGTQINVYRGDKRIGAVRVTEPAHPPLATADIVEGEVRVGDDAR
jgi:hypothetical protein